MKKQDPVFDAALALHRAGKLEQAAQAYRRILKLRPGHGRALNNLGVICQRLGLFNESRKFLESALTKEPQAWSNLASLEIRLGRFSEAAVAARRATELLPNLAAAYDNLAFSLFRLDAGYPAEEAARKAITLDPSCANCWNNLGQILQRQNRLPEATHAYQQSVALDNSSSVAHTNLLFCMHFDDRYSNRQIFESHLQWAKRYEAPILSQPPKHQASPVSLGRRPKVAMISPDLHAHPVAMFLRPLIAHWPHERMELGFYASVKSPDAVTQWFENRADFWCDILPLSDERAAQRIANDEVDILIDLTGHTGDSRLKVLAYRPAPIQMSWLGYFDTTGMESVQYILTDAVCVTTEMEQYFAEKVLRMPDDFVCFEPPSDAPNISHLPAIANGHITFGSQNQLAKVTDAVLDLWAQVLLQTPSSRLLFQAKAFNNPDVLKRISAKFSDRGVETSRIDFIAAVDTQQILRNYCHIDIALDPFPCAGGTTTCEALWMGVPVVTLLGDRFGGRHSASHLNTVGLNNLIAVDTQGYLEIVQSLCQDLAALGRLRAGLREQMRRSPLCDGPRYADNFEKIINSIITDFARREVRHNT